MLNPTFNDLVNVMARLRAEDGCPWDKEQTHLSLKQYLLEESYEVLQAIDDKNDQELKTELGDVLLQVLFHSQIANEENRFSINDVIETIHNKLVRRHPHVFGNVKVNGTQEVLQNWEAIKAQEKAESNGQNEKATKLFLDSVSQKMPAIIEARQLTERAAYVNFDWANVFDCIGKLQEEVKELEEVISVENSDKQARLQDEVGDLLFVVINIARLLKVDPESALKRTNNKFRKRFAHIEKSLKQQGKELAESNLEEMDLLWKEAKSFDL